MKGIYVAAIVVSIALILFGIFYHVPEKQVDVSRYAYGTDWGENRGAEYLNGDCYNYIVEASLKAGYMSGVMTMKTLSIIGGILLFFMSMFFHTHTKEVSGSIDEVVNAFFLEKGVKPQESASSPGPVIRDPDHIDPLA